jgi:hypothetical protein
MMSSVARACLVLSVLQRGEWSAVWRRAVESLRTVAVPGEWSIVLALHYSRTVVVYHEWAAGRLYTIAACCEWLALADRCCPTVVLQAPCPYVWLAFDVPPAACFTCVWYRSCRVASWKIRTRPDGRSR